jgi:peroxiredoxin
MQYLAGGALPDVELPSTAGGVVNPLHEEGWVVYVFYPYTGRPGFSDPPNWDKIKGAHGSTPQNLAYSKLYPSYQNKTVKVFGVSLQSTDWQLEFVERSALAFPLLSCNV